MFQKKINEHSVSLAGKAREFYHRRSVRSILIVVFTFIALLQIVYSSIYLVDGVKTYRSAATMSSTNEIFDELFDAAQNLAQERSRTNIVLRSAEPISVKNRVLLNEKRISSAYLLEKALNRVRARHPEPVNFIESGLKSLEIIRERVDQNAGLKWTLRDSSLPDLIFQDFSELLSRIEDLLHVLTNVEDDPKGLYTKLSLSKLHAFQLRNILGRESSLMISAVSDGSPIGEVTRGEMSRLRERGDFLWLTISRYNHDFKSTDIEDAVALVHTEYFEKFRMAQRGMLRLPGGTYSMKAEEYLKASTPAFASIEQLMKTTSIYTQQYSAMIKEQARRKLELIAVETTFVLILLILAVVLINVRVIRPLERLSENLQNLTRGDYDAGIREISFHDEFGALNRGLTIFRGNLMERKQIEVEREKLIIDLSRAISHIKKLSGLLPICACCKKIRNDQGYWQQIENYIRDHSEADFSHGICPDCAKALYSEFYRDRSEEKKE